MKNVVRLAIAALALVGGAGGHAAMASVTATTSIAPAACGGNLEPWFSSQGNGYAGGAVYVLEFSNIDKGTCQVKGYPTVTLTEDGKQVGLKSKQYPLVPVRTVTLRPGQTAHAVLYITDAGAVCRPVPTNGLAIRVPDGVRPSIQPLVAFGGCRGKSTLRVDAINPGVGIPFYTIH